MTILQGVEGLCRQPQLVSGCPHWQRRIQRSASSGSRTTVCVSSGRNGSLQRRKSAKHIACATRQKCELAVGTPSTGLPQGRCQSRSRTLCRASGQSGQQTGEEALYDVVVVGGGISGLATLQALSSSHGHAAPNVLLTEARDRVGGNITSRANDDGYIWEEGPNSFQPNDSVLQLAVDASVDKDLVFGDPKSPRFVWWDGKLRPTPSGPDALTFDLLSIWGKVRAGLGAIGLFKAPMPGTEESVEQFIRRNLGAEVFERLIDPFCSGVYAGDPSKLGMQAAFGKIWELEKKGGSLVGGALKLFQDKKKNPPPPRNPKLPPKPAGQTVGSFRKGLQMLPEAIAKNMREKIRLKWNLKDISKNSEGVFTLLYDSPEGKKEIKTKALGLTVPAYVAADLLRKGSPDVYDALKSFDYPPVAAVTLSYPISAIREDRKDSAQHMPGFGQLHPRSQGITTLGTIYSSSLFPNRAPEKHVLLLNYIGGAKNRSILDQTQDEIVQQVDKDVRKMLVKPDAPEPRVIGVRIWPKAIPQFNVGHLQSLAAAQAALEDIEWNGVFLGGNYVSGVALGKCVEYGYDFAKKLADYAASVNVESKVKEAFFV